MHHVKKQFIRKAGLKTPGVGDCGIRRDYNISKYPVFLGKIKGYHIGRVVLGKVIQVKLFDQAVIYKTDSYFARFFYSL